MLVGVNGELVDTVSLEPDGYDIGLEDSDVIVPFSSISTFIVAFS
jgi:hypothetical protein